MTATDHNNLPWDEESSKPSSPSNNMRRVLSGLAACGSRVKRSSDSKRNNADEHPDDEEQHPDDEVEIIYNPSLFKLSAVTATAASPTRGVGGSGGARSLATGVVTPSSSTVVMMTSSSSLSRRPSPPGVQASQVRRLGWYLLGRPYAGFLYAVVEE